MLISFEHVNAHTLKSGLQRQFQEYFLFCEMEHLLPPGNAVLLGSCETYPITGRFDLKPLNDCRQPVEELILGIRIAALAFVLNPSTELKTLQSSFDPVKMFHTQSVGLLSLYGNKPLEWVYFIWKHEKNCKSKPTQRSLASLDDGRLWKLFSWHKIILSWTDKLTFLVVH